MGVLSASYSRAYSYLVLESGGCSVLVRVLGVQWYLAENVSTGDSKICR